MLPEATPLWIAILLFAGAAGAVWAAGTRLAQLADGLARRTGIAQTTIGFTLLGIVTSLPELAVTSSAAYRGSATLAVDSILGGVAFQVMILAVLDAAIGRDALSAGIRDPAILLLAALCVLLLTLVVGAVLIGDAPLLGVGAWTWGIAGLYALSVWVVSVSRRRRGWQVAGAGEGDAREEARGERPRPGGPQRSAASSAAQLAGTAVAIVAAGIVLTETAEKIAADTRLGTSFVGAVGVAAATSLPELSTALAAARLGRYAMAIADVFGANLTDLALLFVADAIYQGAPVLDQAGRFSGFAALLGIALTTLYLVGLIERRDRTVARMGVDSLAVLIAYAGGLAILYQLR